MLAVLSSLGYAPGGAPLRVHAQRSSRISLSPSMAGSLVVTDGTDSFYGSRSIVQTRRERSVSWQPAVMSCPTMTGAISTSGSAASSDEAP